MVDKEIIRTRINSILPMLDERQTRAYLSAEAASLGWGGKTIISELSSITRRTIARGGKEVISGENNLESTRIRKVGGGRKKISELQPELLQTIQNLVSPHTMGDPMKPLMWTRKVSEK